MNEIIKVKNLSYSYPDGTKALNNISLDIERGQRIAIMGANGSGKSTFFLHLNGVIDPVDGEVIVDGIKVGSSKEATIETRKKVGIIFQNPDDQLFAASIRQEISFGPLNLGLTEEETIKRVDASIEKLGLKEIEHKPTHFLSGGQKKKVAVADIIVMEPEIIIFDEPAAALDPKHIVMLDEIIYNLSEEGKTILVSTHDCDRAVRWADRVILFNNGQIIGDGTPEEIFNREDLLKQTNLEKPAVVTFFDSLKENGILKDDLKMPRTMEELDVYIKNAFSDRCICEK